MAFTDCTTSGQETEWVHSYNPGAHTGPITTNKYQQRTHTQRCKKQCTILFISAQRLLVSAFGGVSFQLMPQVALDGFKLSSVSVEQYVSHIDQLLAQKAFVLGSGCVSKSILDSYGMLQSYTHTYSLIHNNTFNGHILNIFVTTIDTCQHCKSAE